MSAQPEFMTLKGDGLNLQAAQWGGDGPVVICIHGMAANCMTWAPAIHGLPQGPRFIAVDLRGRGRSDKPAKGYTVYAHARDILAMMDSLKLWNAVIMGHSLGALIGLVLAAQNPKRVQKLILVDGGGSLSPSQTAKVLDGIKPTLDRLGKVFPSIGAYLDLMKAAPMLQPWNRYIEDFYLYDTEILDGGMRSGVPAQAIQEEIDNLGLVDAAALQKKVTCPTLILRARQGMLAEDDLLLPDDVAAAMQENMADATLVDLVGANHYSILLQPNEDRDAAIKSFLEI